MMDTHQSVFLLPMILPIAQTDQDSVNSGGSGTQAGDNGGSAVDPRIERIENNIASMDRRLTKVEADISQLKTDVGELKQEVRDLRWWVLGTCIGSILAMIGVACMMIQWQSSWTQDAIKQRADADKAFLEQMDRRWEERFGYLNDKIRNLD